jgi:hypothetical protein
MVFHLVVGGKLQKHEVWSFLCRNHYYTNIVSDSFLTQHKNCLPLVHSMITYHNGKLITDKGM